MSTITNTNTLDKHQVKKLLEYNRVNIVKDYGTYYQITCPNCRKPEAFIEYIGDMRWIKCNRENNCYENDIPAYNKKLWEFLADELGIDENETKQIVKYINDTLAKPDIEISPVVFQEKEFELTEDDLTFLEHCDEIFKETILEDNDQVKFVKDYLQEERGYTEDIIRKFEIGILPPAKDIISKMVEKYSYEEETARGNIEKLLNVTKWNDSTSCEFTKNNITVAGIVI